VLGLLQVVSMKEMLGSKPRRAIYFSLRINPNSRFSIREADVRRLL